MTLSFQKSFPGFVEKTVNRIRFITLLQTITQEGWLYLALVIDLYSRQVVGLSMSECMQAKMVNDALITAWPIFQYIK
jgi:transposase InsO family protein